MKSKRLEIYPRDNTGKAKQLQNDFNSFNDINIIDLKIGKCYLISDIKELDLEKMKDEIFYDDVIEDCYVEYETFKNQKIDYDYFVDVQFRPGVTDNPSKSCEEALSLYGLYPDVYSSTLYLIKSPSDFNAVSKLCNKLLGNNLIQEIKVFSKGEINETRRFREISLPKVELKSGIIIDVIDLENMNNNELSNLSDKRCLALNLDELNFIKTYYKGIKKKRLEKGLPTNPTDVEVEVLAQTWSEHCKHKIFSAKINYTDEKNKKYQIDSLYKTYIKGATQKIKSDRNLDWLRSVFTDNAGIVRFDKNVDLCIKVETHNSPSALDPYGGALTGILGVNRDILGCGLGAKPIANMDVFCLADPTIPSSKEDENRLPADLMNPKQILEGLHKGVEDGGNKSGVPTVNGAMVFDRDYAGKPLVFVGTVGVMPQKLKDGRKIEVKEPQIGDYVVMVGGAIGADGIHGATFSSLELNETSPSTAVQIGDPLTQKRVSDFIIAARDECLFTCITDNGAGGLSSSVGEMATLTGGAKIDLRKCPIKYLGLSPYELMISESQERMTLAVCAEKKDRFLELSHFHGVESSFIGHFHNKGELEIFYDNEIVASLSLEFLHESLPQMNLEACWDRPRDRSNWLGDKRETVKLDEVDKQFISNAITKLLESPNIASKEKYVRRYDHEVQAATISKPFVGTSGHGPGNAGGVWLYPHGGEESNGIMISNGLCPRMSLSDPYKMTLMAVDESLRNVVAQGGDPDHCVLLDNFCWPDPQKSKMNPHGDYKLGQLVKSCEALFDITTTYGTPLVSGKDSMKNDFRGKNRKGEELKISVLPTLLVTALAKCDVNKIMSSDFKNEGDVVYELGYRGPGLLHSEFLELFEIEYPHLLPQIDIHENIKLYRLIYEACSKGVLESCHDVSDGGMILALIESCFGNNKGLDLSFSTPKDVYKQLDYLFNESAGRFIVSVKKENITSFESIFKNLFIELGEVNNADYVSHKELDINLSVNSCINIWKGALQ